VVSPTSTRYALLIVSLLLASTLAGRMLHNDLFEKQWLATMQHCSTIYGPLQTKAVADHDGDLLAGYLRDRAACEAPADNRVLLVTLAAVSAVVVIGLMLVWITPVLTRRRLRLSGRSRSGFAQARFDELCQQWGFRRNPRLVVGPSELAEAFTTGPPGRPVVVLPQILALPGADREDFDVVVHHELGHVRAHDVSLVVLARSAWIALLPVLALPALWIIWLAVDGHPGGADNGPFLAEYLARSGVLLGVAMVIAAALLRSREHDADLRAIDQVGDSQALLRLLEAAPPPMAQHWWNRLTARHPSIARRALIIRRPELLARALPVDGFIAALLAGMSWPPVNYLGRTLLNGTFLSGLGKYLPTLLIGSLLGAAIGSGLWRQAQAGLSQVATRSALLAGCVGAGMVTGQNLSLAEVGQTTLTGFDPGSTMLSFAASAMATVLCAGIAEVCHAGQRSPSRWVSSTMAIGSAALVFVMAQSTVATATTYLSGGYSWSELASALITTLGSGRYPEALAGLAVAVAVYSAVGRRTASVPAPSEQAAERPGLGDAVVLGLTAGLVGAVGAVTYRVHYGPMPELAQKLEVIQTGWWIAVAAGVACLLILPRAAGLRGLGMALFAAPIAVLVAASGRFVQNAIATPSSFDLSGFSIFTRTPIGVTLVSALLLAPLALLPTGPSWLARSARFRLLAIVALTAVLILVAVTSDSLLLWQPYLRAG
jgi:Zn-dependent protease with chaperone function